MNPAGGAFDFDTVLTIPVLSEKGVGPRVGHPKMGLHDTLMILSKSDLKKRPRLSEEHWGSPLCLPESEKSISHVKGELLASGGRRTRPRSPN